MPESFGQVAQSAEGYYGEVVYEIKLYCKDCMSACGYDEHIKVWAIQEMIPLSEAELLERIKLHDQMCQRRSHDCN